MTRPTDLPRFRHRTGWRGRLVLQIAETVPTNYDPQTDDQPHSWAIVWRDATVADLSEHFLMPLFPEKGLSDGS